MNLTKRHKQILGGVGGTIVLLLILSQLLLAMVDADAALDPLRVAVKELTGQPLITERVSASVLSGPKIEVAGIAIRSLTETQEPYVLYADKLVIELPFSALWSDEVEPDHMGLYGLRLYLEKDRRGVHNWAFIDAMRERASALERLTLSLHRASVRYVDLKEDHTFEVERISGELSLDPSGFKGALRGLMMERSVKLSGGCDVARFAHLNQFDAQCKGELNGEGLQLSADHRLLMGEKGLQTRGTLQLQTDDIRGWGDALFSQQHKTLETYLNAALPLKGTIETYHDASQLVANVTQFDLGASRGRLSLKRTAERGRPQLAVNAVFSQLQLDELTSLARDSSGTSNDWFTSDGAAGVRAGGSVSLSAQTVRYSGLDIRSVSAKGSLGAGELVIEELRGSLPGSGSLLALGQLAPTINGLQFQGLIEASGKQLSALMPLLGLKSDEASRRVFTNYRARLNATVNPKSTILSDLRVITGQRVRIAGGVTLERTGERAVSGSLSVENLDLAPFQAEWLQGASLRDSPEALKGRTPFGFTWLRAVERPISMALSLRKYKLFGRSGNLARLQMELEPGSLAFPAIDARLGTMRASGDVRIARRAETSKADLSGQLRLSELDLGNAVRDAWWAAPSELKKTRTDNSVWSRQPLNFNPIRHMNGQLALQIDKLKHEVFEARQLSMNLALQNAVLSAKDFRMRLWGGRWQGDWSLDAQVLPALTWQFEATQLQLRELLAALMDQHTIGGGLRLTGNVKTSGLNPSEWMRNLAGGLSFDGRGLVIQSFNVPAMLRAVQVARSASALPNAIRLSLERGTARFGAMKGVTYFDAGSLKTTEVTLESREATARLDASWDLLQWQLDAHLRLLLTPLAEQNPPTLLVHLLGAPEKLQRRLDLKSLEAYLAQKRR